MSGIDIHIQRKQFPAVGEAPSKEVIRALGISVADREFVCLIGPSGCGKTSLLNMIAGLDKDFDGTINLSNHAGRLGYVFQNPRLLPWMTVIENLTLVLDHLEDPHISAMRMLNAIGLEDVAEVYPERLSVGMARRVALARAFVIEPDILLMDEPFVSVDEPTAERLRTLLIDIWRQHPTTVLFVTHGLREALALADRILFLSPSPSCLQAEYRVGVDRDQRDSTVIEKLRAELLARDDIKV